MNDKLKFTYIAIHEGQQTAILGEDDLQDWADQVNDGQATVLRILAYSDMAKAHSGKECRVEEMQVEEVEQEEPEEEDDSADAPSPADKWNISWKLVK
jgi:hypothetical protein